MDRTPHPATTTHCAVEYLSETASQGWVSTRGRATCVPQPDAVGDPCARGAPPALSPFALVQVRCAFSIHRESMPICSVRAYARAAVI